jgi:hypothetical protein
MSDSRVHLIQSFSFDPGGDLLWDSLLWSTDGGFAPLLARSLAARRAGILHLRTELDADGRPAEICELVSGCGSLPTSLFVRPQSAPALALEIERGRGPWPLGAMAGLTSRSS